MDINNNFDVCIELSSKIEIELYKELNQAFPEDDVQILKIVAKRREKLRTKLGPMYTKLSRRSLRKFDKTDNANLEKMSEDS